MKFTTEYNPKKKLTQEQIQEIKLLIQQGVPNRSIAEQFNVSEAHISRIKRGKRYNETNN